MTVVLVEGESDRIAVEVIARRLGQVPPRVLAVGGSKGARRMLPDVAVERAIGLVDVRERADFERDLAEVYVCDPDLEGEFIRALGVAGVEAVISEAGELESFRGLQRQPAQRGRAPEAQLSRFFGGRSGNKSRYAHLLAEAVPLDRIPAVLVALLAAAGDGQTH